MFLLRRKSDGKYYKNRDYHSVRRTYNPEFEWTDDLRLCIPFRTKAAIKQCRAVYGRTPYPHPKVWNDETRKTWYEEKNKFFDLSFEIVEVFLKGE